MAGSKRPMDQRLESRVGHSPLHLGGQWAFEFSELKDITQQQPQAGPIKRQRSDVNLRPSPTMLSNRRYPDIFANPSDTTSMAPPPTTFPPEYMHLFGAASGDTQGPLLENSLSKGPEELEDCIPTPSTQNPLLLDEVTYPRLDHLEQDLPHYETQPGTAFENELRPRTDDPFSMAIPKDPSQNRTDSSLLASYCQRSTRDSIGSSLHQPQAQRNALAMATRANQSQSEYLGLSDSAYQSNFQTPGTPSVFSGDSMWPRTPRDVNSLSLNLDALDFRSQLAERDTHFDLFPDDNSKQACFWSPARRSSYLPPQSTVEGAESVVGPPFACKHCKESSFRNKSEFKKHLLRHEKPFRCYIAGCTRIAGFSTRNDLDRHRKSCHKIAPGTSTDKTYKCAAEACARVPKVWPRADNFRQHCTRKHKDLNLEELVENSVCFDPHDAMGHNEAHEPLNEYATADMNDSNVQKEYKRTTAVSTYSSSFQSESDKIPHPIAIALSNPFKKKKSASSAPVSHSTKRPRLCESTQSSTPSRVPKANESRACTQSATKLPRIKQQEPRPTSSTGCSSLKLITASNNVEPNPPLFKHYHEDLPPSLLIAPATSPREKIGPKAYPASRPVNSLPSSQKQTLPSTSKPCLGASPPSRYDRGCSPIPKPTPTHQDTAPLSLVTPVEKIEELKRMCPDLSNSLNKLLKEMSQAPMKSNITCSTKSEPLTNKESLQDALPCPDCEKVKKTPSDFRKHRLRHFRPYSCTTGPKCQGRFGSKNDWKRHERVQHDDPSFIAAFWCALPHKFKYDKSIEEKELEARIYERKGLSCAVTDDEFGAGTKIKGEASHDRCEELGVANPDACMCYFDQKSKYYEHLHSHHNYLDPQIIEHYKYGLLWRGSALSSVIGEQPNESTTSTSLAAKSCPTTPEAIIDTIDQKPKWYQNAKEARKAAKHNAQIGHNGTRGFWCGFCNNVIPLPKDLSGTLAWEERYIHIDAEHFQGLIRDLFEKEDEMKATASKRRKEMGPQRGKLRGEATSRLERLEEMSQRFGEKWVMIPEQKTRGTMRRENEKEKKETRDDSSDDNDSDEDCDHGADDGCVEETPNVSKREHIMTEGNGAQGNAAVDYTHDSQEGQRKHNGEDEGKANIATAHEQKARADSPPDASTVFDEDGHPYFNPSIIEQATTAAPSASNTSSQPRDVKQTNTPAPEAGPMKMTWWWFCGDCSDGLVGKRVKERKGDPRCRTCHGTHVWWEQKKEKDRKMIPTTSDRMKHMTDR